MVSQGKNLKVNPHWVSVSHIPDIFNKKEYISVFWWGVILSNVFTKLQISGYSNPVSANTPSTFG